jgi:hypothetical protein
MELHLAADDASAAVLNQSHDGQRRDRFARTGFTNDCERFAAVDLQAEIAHRLDLTFRGRKVHRQLLYVENPGRRSGLRTVQSRPPAVLVDEARDELCVMSITGDLYGESI